MYQASLPIEDKQTDNSYLMLKSLLSIGIDTDAIGVMMDLQGFHPQHICYFAGPVIVHDLPWKEQLPGHLIKACYLERLELVCKERKSNFGGVLVGNQAAQADVLAAMFPALMEALVNPNCGIPWQWGKVALYCSAQVGLRHKWIGSIEECYQQVNMEPISFKEIETNFKHIAQDVRSRVVKMASSQGWGKPMPLRTNDSLPRPTTTPRHQVESVQLELL
jgi:hypothetical protein